MRLVRAVVKWSIWLPAYVSRGAEHVSNKSDVLVRIYDDESAFGYGQGQLQFRAGVSLGVSCMVAMRSNTRVMLICAVTLE